MGVTDHELMLNNEEEGVADSSTVCFHVPSSEIDRYLLEFRGSSFPLSALGSYSGSGGGGGRRARDSGKLRRSNTSPRKKGGLSSNWGCGGSFREGEVAKHRFLIHEGSITRI